MVIEEKDLLNERTLETWWDYEEYNEDIESAIGIVEEYYDLTKTKIENALLTRKGYVNERSSYGEYYTCIQAKYMCPTYYDTISRGGEYLIQIVNYGTILFSKVYYDVPTKIEFIQELKSLKKDYVLGEDVIRKIEKYSKLSHEELLEIVSNDPFEILYIKNPSLEIQMTVVKNNPQPIHYISTKPFREVIEYLKSQRVTYQGFVGF